MSDVYAAMPALQVPPNSREILLAQKDMLCLNIRLSLTSLTFNVMCGLECIVISIIVLYGAREFHYYEPFDCAVVIFWVCFFYVLMAAIGLFTNMRRMSLYGVPVIYGYTQELFYGASSLHQSVNRWEIYTHWKETNNYFLLRSQGQWNIIPKNMWTREEQEELRLIMKNKVGKPYAIP